MNIDENPPTPQAEEFSSLLKHKPSDELNIVKLIESIMSIPRYSLAINQWLSQLDDFSKPDTVLLFDGLDTGFGSNDKDRKRRNVALEGLFTFMTDTGGRLKFFRLKVLLREDIWRSLKFENKSHFFGRSLTLKWEDQVSFLKVAIKQALRNPLFKKLLQKTNSLEIEQWGESEVISAWNLLVGERMKGGKTAFTRNWVWKRLSDGNNDHSPRYLLQLISESVKWEKMEHIRSSYERSVIRPRGLTNVLPRVSEQALSALRNEEFPELEKLMEKLTSIGRTPINASDIQFLEYIALASEVGLLGIYEESGEKVERYFVPELFRHALKMTRKGQM